MRALVTGSCGLIGSAVVELFDSRFQSIVGMDNNSRMAFFGPGGDTSRNLARLEAVTANFRNFSVDITDRSAVDAIVARQRPHVVVHCAAQPSHDWSAREPYRDFLINVVGTMNLLEAVRIHAPEAVFIFLSTNKVYGDTPNGYEMIEHASRYDYIREIDWFGIDESCPIDQSTHSVFGASKASADLLVQEYGRYFGMNTTCLRGGCLTGASHAGVELHGFLSYLVKCVVKQKPYTVYGHKGKQVRDNLHATDVAAACWEIYSAPRSAAVYNLGGGRNNSISVLEALHQVGHLIGEIPDYTIVEEPRAGDHICYISDTRRLEADYPGWKPRVSIEGILTELIDHERRAG